MGINLSPTLRVVDHGGKPAVLKRYPPVPCLGELLARREHRFLLLLEKTPGFPRTYGRVGPTGVLTELIDGRPLNKFHAGDLEDRVFARLDAVVRSMHRRGVAHLDLRHRKNILITPAGEPVVIDFAGAMERLGIGRLLWDALVKIDESALLKIKKRIFPRLLTPSDLRSLRRHRFLRRFWVFTPRGRHVR